VDFGFPDSEMIDAMRDAFPEVHWFEDFCWNDWDLEGLQILSRRVEVALTALERI
jgi:hypothetical protein